MNVPPPLPNTSSDDMSMSILTPSITKNFRPQISLRAELAQPDSDTATSNSGYSMGSTISAPFVPFRMPSKAFMPSAETSDSSSSSYTEEAAAPTGKTEKEGPRERRATHLSKALVV